MESFISRTHILTEKLLYGFYAVRDLSKYFEISSYTIIYRGRRFEVRKHHGFPSNSFFPVIFRRGCKCDGKANLIFSV